MLHFTAFWKHKVPNNAVKWVEKCLILRKKPAKWRDFVVLEQVTGLELVIYPLFTRTISFFDIYMAFLLFFLIINVKYVAIYYNIEKES